MTKPLLHRHIHPLFLIHQLSGSSKVFYTIPILIMCFIGFIENVFAFQTFLYSFIYGKICRRHLIYLLILSMNGILSSILLSLAIFCSTLKEFVIHINLFDIFCFLSVIMNTFSIWISCALSIDIALFNVYIGKMVGLSSYYAVITSILLLLSVVGSYISWIINEPFSINIVSTICSLFHLLVPCLIHTISTIISLKFSIRRRMNLLKNKTTYFQQLLSHQEHLRCLILIIICTIPYSLIVIIIYSSTLKWLDEEILSSNVQILLITFIFLHQMLTFHVYISSRKSYMREYRNITPLGKLMNKLYSKDKQNKKGEHLPKEGHINKY